MNTSLIFVTRIDVFALFFYTIGILIEQKKKHVSKIVLIFLTAGISFDILATVFMIIGSPNSPFTLHGFLGYSALACMFIDTLLIWKIRIQNGLNAKVHQTLHIYSILAYLWWVIAFITGSLLVFLK